MENAWWVGNRGIHLYFRAEKENSLNIFLVKSVKQEGPL